MIAPLAVSLLASVTPAYAGMGVTGSVGGDYDGTAWAPSLDWREGRLLVQLHLLDQLAPLAAGTKVVPRTGLDVCWGAARDELGPGVDAILMPGVGARVDGVGPVGWNVRSELRAGVELHRRLGVGAYVVPTLGVTTLVTGSLGVSYGGTVQLSVWGSP